MPNDAVAIEVDAVRSTANKRLRISISTPYEKPTGEWACLFRLNGVPEEDEQREYFGVDALQALVLNLFYLRFVLARLRKKGFSFHATESGEPINPEMYFDVLTKPA